MMGTLEKLLERIRDGVASGEEVAKARELVAHDARLPEELREIGLTDAEDLPGDAVGLLAVLGAAPLFDEGLREAITDTLHEGAYTGHEGAYTGHEGAYTGHEGARPLRHPYGSGHEGARPLRHPCEGLVDEGVLDDGWEEVAEVLREGLVAAADGFEIASSVMARLPAPEWAYGPVTAEAVRGEAGTVDVAGEAMADLGDALPPVAEAVGFEAGTVDVVASVLSELSLEAGLPVEEAVAAEAGTVDVVASVVTELELATALPVGEAVAAEAGTVDVAAQVMEELVGPEEASVADAVAAEAGSVTVAEEVLESVTPPTALPAPPPSVLHEAPPVPQAANRSWTLGALLMAAVALLVVGLSQLPGFIGAESQGLDLEFAAAGELVVEDLDYADDVTVMQAEGDEGAVILWMEDV